MSSPRPGASLGTPIARRSCARAPRISEPARRFFSSARTSSAWGLSSSAALSTPSPSSIRRSAVRAWFRSLPAITRRRSRRRAAARHALDDRSPRDAPALKVSATRGYGAGSSSTIVTARTRGYRPRLARRRGLASIPSYDHPHVIAGQGTAALELFEETGPLDALFVCLGGGGLLSGSSIVARSVSPACKLYGAEPAAGNDGSQILAPDTSSRSSTPRTIADGAQYQRRAGSPSPSSSAWSMTSSRSATAELVDSVRFFAERMKMIVEPRALLGFAAAQKRARAPASA